MIRAVLTDIEGTTTDVRFVTDTLFPFARERLPAFVAAHGTEPAVKAELDAVRAETDPGATDARVAEILRAWIDEDRKATPLKELQGMIWRAGYESGDLLAHVYADVPLTLYRWRHERGLRLAVYSSGSVSAQKLLFGHSLAGDLTGLFEAWFDTRTGPKKEQASYTAIAGELGLAAGEILFLSDSPAETAAARAAGCVTIRIDRSLPPLELNDGAEEPVAGSFLPVADRLGG